MRSVSPGRKEELAKTDGAALAENTKKSVPPSAMDMASESPRGSVAKSALPPT